jgi:phage virion morphogenesis protein
MDIKVNVSGLEEMAGDIAAAAARAADLSPVTKPAAERLRSIITLSFSQSKSPLGEPWRPLAESTVARRRMGSSKPLIDTGLLRKSVATRGEKQGVVFGVSGSAGEYAQFHQFGTRKIPRRAFMPTDASGKPVFDSGSARKWIEQTMKAALDYIANGAKRASGRGHGNTGGAG